MLDKTLISIVSMAFGGVGLIGAITKYDFPRARKTTYGENLFLVKENTINNVTMWFFTIYATIGLLFQVVFGEILEFTERLYDVDFYLWAFAIALAVIGVLIPMIKVMSKWVARSYWLPEVSQKSKDAFLLAKSIISSDGEDNSDSKRVVEIVNWLEELFEIKSEKRDLVSRLEFFEKTFKK